MDTRRVVLGSLTFDIDRLALTREGGEDIMLGQKALALLAALAEAHGDVVAKAALLERVWPGTYVEEGNLTVQIASLRKALGAAPGGREWIVTVPRVGYRLAVDAVGGTAAGARSEPMPPRLAVPGLRPVGESRAEREFAEAVTADLVTALARFRTFAAVGVDTVESAAYLLEGTVQRANDRLRLNVRLIDNRDGSPLWAERFDGSFGDFFDFQDQITERVAALIDPAIETAELNRSRRERPGSVAAYDIYLMSLAKITDESALANAEAYSLLRRALDHEPDNALFLAHAAWLLEHRLAMGWPPLGEDDRERCVAYARRGYSLANGDARIMTHCGMALLQADRDYDTGMAAVRAAYAINPNDLIVVAAAGIATAHCGDIDEAMSLLLRAVALGPSDPDARLSMTGIAMIEVIRGNHTDAISWALRSLAINEHFDPTYWMLAAANAHLGRMDEARAWIARLRELAPATSLASIRAGQCAKYPERIGAVLDGLARAGLE